MNMPWPKLGVAILGLLASAAWGQDAPDLSKDPRLQQTVDVHMKRALVPTLMDYLRKHTDQRYLVAQELDPLMVCVYAEKQPLWLVMKDVAAVLGAQWKDVGSGWRLLLPPESNSMIDSYEADEQKVLRQDVYLRAKALSEKAARRKWSPGGPESKLSEKEVPVDENPEQWADRVISRPEYYAAGIMFARTSILEQARVKLDCAGGFFESLWPTAYRLIAPRTPEIAETNQCSDPSDCAPALEGLRIAVRRCTWAGTLQAVAVDEAGHKAEKPPQLIRFPKPENDIAKTKAGKWLLDWETSLEESHEAALDTAVGSVEPANSTYVGGGQGIEDYLEAFSNATHLLVVCDGFRMPVSGKDRPATGASVRAWLNTFRESQKCFVKVENGSVMVRHGGFWDLRKWEPSEETLRRFEAIGHPGLDDYADLAISLCTTSSLIPDSWTLPFFDSKQVPLTRFDSEPLRDSTLPLAAYGQMTENQRYHILGGGSVDLHRNVANETRIQVFAQNLKDSKGRTVQWYDTEVHKNILGNDYFLNASAVFGMFYGGRALGFEPRLLESFVLPSWYRHLWGDNPTDNPLFVNTYSDVLLAHAYYLSLKGLLIGIELPPKGAPRTITGTLSFFASISDDDGVLNEVVIPMVGSR